jgi:predicted Rossmann fold flavoprotein
LGTKILISGGGKCNITHDGTPDELLSAFSVKERRFLQHAVYRFGNRGILDLLEAGGITTAPRPNGRVFPVNGIAKDVMRVLSGLLVEHGVVIRYHQRVEELLLDGDQVRGVRIGESFIPARHLILATGGASYPQTGTTGDGFSLAEHSGHRLVKVRAALAPIRVAPAFPGDWQGVAIRGGCLSVMQNGRKIARWTDDVLFTHEGLSGPATLEVSRAAALARESGPVSLRMDFFPGKEDQTVDDEFQAVIRLQPGRMIGTVLGQWLPNRIVDRLLRSNAIDPEQRGQVLPREQRKLVVRLLKDWEMGSVEEVLLDRGEVTAGGIALGDIDPRTMESRRVKGLYLCGEILDVAGPVGGYNLQAAFSTGFVAGDTAATRMQSSR